MRKMASSGGGGPESAKKLRERVALRRWEWSGRRRGMTVPEKGRKMKERLDKVIVVFQVRKKGVIQRGFGGRGGEWERT